jgi:hypothetical protein
MIQNSHQATAVIKETFLFNKIWAMELSNLQINSMIINEIKDD